MTDTLLLTGAELADGTGRALRSADVLLEGTRIRAVEPPAAVPRGYHPTRDLTGLVLAPGFVDVHSHADNAPLLAEHDTTKILQGVTTEIVGNCGFSLAPVTTERADTFAAFLQRIFPPVPLRWRGFAELFAALDEAGSVTNFCPLVGHTSLRIAATGMSASGSDTAALRWMRTDLDEGMQAGAFGLSSGLIYPPALFAETAELRALAEVVGSTGVYATHLRDEGAGLLGAIDEALDIGARAGRTHISHLKAAGPPHWGSVPRALARLDAARACGRAVSQDTYPYTASSTMLTAALPEEFLADDDAVLLRRLATPSGRARLAEMFADGRPGWQDRGGGWDHILVSTTASHRFEGRTLAQIARKLGTSPAEALAEVLVAERLRASMISFSMHEDDLDAALGHEHTMIGSDGLPPGTGGGPHPRLFGTFPRVLAQYCRQRELVGVAEAVRRMSAFPAEAFGIGDRGVIAPGKVADLVAFDPVEVTDVGSYRDPVHPPAGVRWVALGGTTVVDGDGYRGGRRGHRLRPSH